MTQPEPINTGTGAARRRLSREDAERGGRPEPYTPAEWRALHRASEAAAADGQRWAAEQRARRDGKRMRRIDLSGIPDGAVLTARDIRALASATPTPEP